MFVDSVKERFQSARISIRGNCYRLDYLHSMSEVLTLFLRSLLNINEVIAFYFPIKRLR